MQLKESFENTKKYLHKTLQNLKSLFVGGYQRLPRATSFKFNPLSRGSNIQKNSQTDDQYFSNFCNEWECDLEKAMTRKNNSGIMVSEEPVIGGEEDACSASSMKLENSLPLKKKKKEVEGREDQRKTMSTRWRKEQEKWSKNKNGEGGFELAKKMKEFEMMDATDMEHVLDVEEAIHYYSRLKSPVYLDIVDKFFTDMYTEFSVPQPSVSINNSKRRLGSIRL